MRPRSHSYTLCYILACERKFTNSRDSPLTFCHAFQVHFAGCVFRLLSLSTSHMVHDKRIELLRNDTFKQHLFFPFYPDRFSMETTIAEHPNDWQVGKSALESMAHLLEAQMHCDVYFMLPFGNGEKKKIGAHTLILKGRSPVFEAMFSDRWNTENNVAKVEDIDHDIFGEFLK